MSLGKVSLVSLALVSCMYATNGFVVTYQGAKSSAMADAFIDEAMKIIPSGNAQIVDNAQIPKSPIKPNKTLNIIIINTRIF